MTGLEGQKALVTGADGFIGSHLVERLVEEDVKVRALCMYNSEGSLGWLEDSDTITAGDIEIALGDVRDVEQMRMLVKGVDVVFHLAALIGIPYSYEAPRSFLQTNTEGTLNLLEAVRDAGTPLMVNTSTSEVYGTPEVLPITERHPLVAQSPYSASKIAADKLCQAYARSFETPVVTLRPFNTYGPRQSLRAIVPTILSQLLAGTSTVRLGNLTPRRDFTYVSDTVDGFVKIANANLDPGTVMHLGSGKALSVVELLELCAEVLGVHADARIETKRQRPETSEIDVLRSDPKLAEEVLGWTPSVSLRDGLAITAEWLANRYANHGVSRYYT